MKIEEFKQRIYESLVAVVTGGIKDAIRAHANLAYDPHLTSSIAKRVVCCLNGHILDTILNSYKEEVSKETLYQQQSTRIEELENKIRKQQKTICDLLEKAGIKKFDQNGKEIK